MIFWLRPKAKSKLWATQILLFFLMAFYVNKTPFLINITLLNLMTIVPVLALNIKSETATASQPITEADEQMQLAIDEARWLDLRDYYQSSQVA